MTKGFVIAIDGIGWVKPVFSKMFSESEFDAAMKHAEWLRSEMPDNKIMISFEHVEKNISSDELALRVGFSACTPGSNLPDEAEMCLYGDNYFALKRGVK